MVSGTPKISDSLSLKYGGSKPYFEWLPIRDNVTAGQYEIYRSVSYGKLVDMVLLDTRLIVMGLYPNPVSTILNVHFSNLKTDEMQMQIIDETGKNVFQESFVCQQGSWIKQINTSEFAKGKYMLLIHDEGNTTLKRSFIKY